jgi:hypothetical protein
MSTFQTRYKNKKFVKERVELDGHSYQHCDFEGCLIILEKGQTEIKNCSFKGCRLLLIGQALSIAKILQIFIGEKPLRVLDFAEPGIFGERKILPQRAQRPLRKNK